MSYSHPLMSLLGCCFLIKSTSFNEPWNRCGFQYQDDQVSLTHQMCYLRCLNIWKEVPLSHRVESKSLQSAIPVTWLLLVTWCWFMFLTNQDVCAEWAGPLTLNESDEATREHFYMCNWATGFYPTKATLYIGSKFIGVQMSRTGVWCTWQFW